MKKIFLSLACLASFHCAKAQYPGSDVPYASERNPWYWKNRLPHGGYWQQDVDYKINARLDDKTFIITADQTLDYKNNSPDTLRVVYFHLYQNAFQPGSYADELQRANKSKPTYGAYERDKKGTEVENIKSTTHGVSSVRLDNTILIVTPEKPIAPGESVHFSMDFKTYFDVGTVRRRMKVFGHNKYLHFDGVHWYPRIAVYDRRHGWETDQHLGKEFYGDFGTFEVNLSLPNNYIVEATGELMNEEEMLPPALRAKLDLKNFANKPLYSPPGEIIAPDGSFKTWRYKAINVHDFSFTADPTYRIGEVNFKGIRCIALAQEEVASRWQSAPAFIARVIEIFSRDFGPYEWPKIVVADARDGMEYNMITLCGGLEPEFHNVISHEIGHEWFYGMVGSNETYRAFMDEGFTQFITMWALEEIDGKYEIRGPMGPGDWRRNYSPAPLREERLILPYIYNAISDSPESINQHSDGYNSALGHGGGYAMVYYKGGTMLANLRYVLGDSLFLAAMKHYVATWKFMHPYPENFRETISHFTGQNLDWFFDQWIESNKVIDYSIRKVRSDKDTTRITFTRKGRMQMPIDFTVTWKDGSKQTYTIPNSYFNKPGSKNLKPWIGWDLIYPEYTAAIPSNGKPKKIEIDTGRNLADVDSRNNTWPYPVKIKLDTLANRGGDRYSYTLVWRPDLWYNAVDGIKAGLHLEGNYLNRRNFLSASVWYNTRLLNQLEGSAPIAGKQMPVNYALSYSNVFKASPSAGYFIDNRLLDGFYYLRGGFTKDFGKNWTSSIYYKTYGLARNVDSAYAISDYDAVGAISPNSHFRFSTFSASLRKNYAARKYFGKITAVLTAPAFRAFGSPLSNIVPAVGSFTIENINTTRLGNLDLRSRLYGKWLFSENYIHQYQALLLGNGNQEDMLESKFYRSRLGSPSLYAETDGYMHTHFTGGLNMRGYTGFATSRRTLLGGQNSMVYLTAGASANVELSFAKVFKIRPKGISRFIALDPYFFGDAGIARGSFVSPSLTESVHYTNFSGQQYLSGYSDLLADAGIGLMMRIKNWGRAATASPLTLRADFPIYTSLPLDNTNPLAFRWLLSVGSAF